MNAQI